MVRARRLALLALAAVPLLATAGCLEERLLVEVTTVVRPDGTCARRVEYRAEHFDGEKSDVAVALAPDQDGLRLFHRFPTAEPWTVRDEAGPRLHVVTAEAILPSPNAIGADYWRARAPGGAPARNHVSFAATGTGPGSAYEYDETFLDPSSPLASLRLLARLLARRDTAFASDLAKALGDGAPPRGEMKRAYRERFARPFAEAVGALAERPVFGPRERKETEGLLDLLTSLQKDLADSLAAASPQRDPEAVPKAVEAVVEQWSEPLQREMASGGLPFPDGELTRKVRFRVTLVMPAPIVRANTCVSGDTATWEFEGDDLFGRGFEMWAKAVSP